MHVKSIMEGLPGGFRSRAAEGTGAAYDLDQTILEHWKGYVEHRGIAV